jgi:hypothetical protein
MYCEKFRKEKEFSSLDNVLIIRKPIRHEDLVGQISTIISQTT